MRSFNSPLSQSWKRAELKINNTEAYAASKMATRKSVALRAVRFKAIMP